MITSCLKLPDLPIQVIDSILLLIDFFLKIGFHFKNDWIFLPVLELWFNNSRNEVIHLMSNRYSTWIEEINTSRLDWLVYQNFTMNLWILIVKTIEIKGLISSFIIDGNSFDRSKDFLRLEYRLLFNDNQAFWLIQFWIREIRSNCFIVLAWQRFMQRYHSRR